MLLVVSLAFVLAAGAALGQGDSFRDLLDKAKAGDAAAQVAVAKKYDNGDGVPENTDQAAFWFRKAADQGNADAQNSLGVAYRLGRGVEKDPKEAMKWFLLAARQKNPSSLFNIGAAYYNGDGVAINDELAYGWFYLAKEAGSAPAVEALSHMGKEISYEEREGAEVAVAAMLLKGDQIGRQPQLAMEIYERLSESGSAVAKVRIARAYMSGAGGVVDESKAEK